MDEIQSQIDEIVTRVEELETGTQDVVDTVDSAVSDLESSLSDHQSEIDTLNENSGQLSFPLSLETIDLIKEQFPSGFTSAMVAGVTTITDPRISPTSNIFMSVALPGGTQGFLSYAATAGQVVFTSTSATETSVLSYLILN